MLRVKHDYHSCHHHLADFYRCVLVCEPTLSVEETQVLIFILTLSTLGCQSLSNASEIQSKDLKNCLWGTKVQRKNIPSEFHSVFNSMSIFAGLKQILFGIFNFRMVKIAQIIDQDNVSHDIPFANFSHKPANEILSYFFVARTSIACEKIHSFWLNEL